MNIALVLLTYNEIECLEKVFPTIPKPEAGVSFDNVYAVDGGSSDGTVEYFQKENIPIIAQSKRGRGDAFQQALKEINADAYIFFSPDGNEDPQDLHKFRKYLSSGADLVIASRMMKGAVNEEDSQLFRWRKWANNAFNLFANLFFKKTGPYITDTINGYRAITREAMQKLNLDALGYTIEYQMSMRALNNKMKIVEFPTIESDRVAGETKAHSIETGIKFLKCLFREVWRKSIKC